MRKLPCSLLLLFIFSVYLNPVLGQKSGKKYEAAVLHVSGFKETGLLEEVTANGIVLKDRNGSRMIEAGSIIRISIKPYRSGRNAFLTGTLIGTAGVGLTYNIQRGYGQRVGRGGLPVLIVSAAAVTGGYFWFMNSVLQTAVFRDVNHPGRFASYRARLERFSIVDEK